MGQHCGRAVVTCPLILGGRQQRGGSKGRKANSIELQGYFRSVAWGAALSGTVDLSTAVVHLHSLSRYHVGVITPYQA
jgi:hypothetical protein